MNVLVKFRRPTPKLLGAAAVPVGEVYSWGAKYEHYLRVDAGSVNLNTAEFVPKSHPHFGESGPRVQVAEAAELSVGYED